ncbi:hypothetical protein SAMN04488096_10749 [Mesonia phycicola]|uniref:Uncharacterized protein n=1 Tax=Mesonia phycicola TaxID=579105 RepID=A0A1M6G034_9FLAO|nr:DUF6702 family protein [Mesonia phycicola]SHJ03257.1 hypothetical protein SAMN04488096_10749 [Mesonia phycicola]
MKNQLSLFITILICFTGFTHQPDIATTVLVEQENNTWILQIDASLTAFQQEVKTHFADTPYKTPEEFREMTLQHIRNNFEIIFNGSECPTLTNGFVQLGHESKVVFNVIGVPSKINSVEIVNTIFKDIYRSQNALIILKKDFNKKKFILNKANNYHLTLKTNKNDFIEIIEQRASLISTKTFFIILGVFLLGIIIKYNYKTLKK